jgi:hypothetical protein
MGCGILSLTAAVITAIITAALISAVHHKPVDATGLTTPPGPTASTRPGPPPTSHPPKTATVLKTSGNGIKNTAAFTTGDTWTIAYTYDCTAFGGTGNMQIYVDYPNGDIAANALGTKGHDTTTETGAGTHTLKVASECRWTVAVTSP